MRGSLRMLTLVFCDSACSTGPIYENTLIFVQSDNGGNYEGGPVGIETIAAALSEPRDAIEDIIEPFLIQCGYLQRTPRGRLLTSHAFRHLGLTEPARDPAQFGLFGQSGEE